jgi:hypothetical protein
VKNYSIFVIAISIVCLIINGLYFSSSAPPPLAYAFNPKNHCHEYTAHDEQKPCNKDELREVAIENCIDDIRGDDRKCLDKVREKFSSALHEDDNNYHHDKVRKTTSSLSGESEKDYNSSVRVYSDYYCGYYFSNTKQCQNKNKNLRQQIDKETNPQIILDTYYIFKTLCSTAKENYKLQATLYSCGNSAHLADRYYTLTGSMPP